MSAPTTQKAKGFLAEFKDFIASGDLMNIAVAFIMAALVKDLIQSFIDNIFNGVLGLVLDNCTKNPDTGKTVCEAFSDQSWKAIQYGAFLNTVFTFVVTGFVVFLVIKAYRRLTGRGLASDGPSTNDILAEIRDELRAQRNG